MKDIGAPANPRPDVCSRYTTNPVPQTLHHSRKRRNIFMGDDSLSHLPPSVQACSSHFAQWKSDVKFGTHFEAKLQGACDDAAVVNATHGFLAISKVNFTVADTIHFSFTYNGDIAVFCAHWRRLDGSVPTWEMERIGRAWIDEGESISEFRQMVRNIFNHALTTRLNKLKEAIAKLRFQFSTTNPSASTTHSRKCQISY
ncbi:hypothetical protein K469DRAFT_753868 [Zopfia rhizophila CBS 207.26]|uniref:DUF7924 domain-containing protein n=1 Tax=Zopfia rhizophila CBS 207.26 TaxID=1314779 RepID=A0A6A6DIY7_9PEZI|nr:hypothetical protein K469DRAFT_753868 [Zopfia rhizophila CBS 207.26]